MSHVDTHSADDGHGHHDDHDAHDGKYDDNGLRWLVRYHWYERYNHWVTAGSFLILAFSGLALFHPSMFYWTDFFGGGQWDRVLHPFFGIVMFVSFFLMVFRYWGDNMITWDDIVWLMKVYIVLQNKEEGLPPVGKYNAGQKMLFFTLIACMVVLLLSGIVIWRRYFAMYFAIEAIRVSALLHATAAFVLILGIMVHIYAAIWVRGSIHAMVRGTVTYGWALQHHPKWFRAMVREKAEKEYMKLHPAAKQ
jgi:formate dehydrogenase subunit gamma